MKPSGKRHVLILIVSSFVLFVSGWLELYLQRKQNLIGAGVSRSFLFLLINAHFIVSIVLLYLIIRHSIKLFTERRKQVPGSAFKRNLFFAFTVFSVIPVVFTFVIAGQLITTSINSWFQARLGQGFVNALLLHQEQSHQERTHIAQMGGVVSRAFSRAFRFNICNVSNHFETIKKKHPILKKYQFYIWSDLGKACLGSMSDEVAVWRTYRKTNDRSTKSLRNLFWQQVHEAQGQEQVFDFFGSLYWVKKIEKKYEDDRRYLVLAYRYPETIRTFLIEIQKSLWDYEQLKLMHHPIYWNYLTTFLLVTLLILFLAMWCAFYLARGISKPIQNLLVAVDKIKKRNLDVTVTCEKTDDLWLLVHGFNEMAQSLKSAYGQLALQNKELSMILGHIKESVFFVNHMGRILTFNVSAKRLADEFLGITRFKNKKISIFGPAVKKEFFICRRELLRSGKTYVTKEITFSHHGEQKTFLAYMTDIASDMNNDHTGTLVIIEDLTEMYKVNKMKTWQEAAKQMAHEIKNPLTPIQLATQRLQRKMRKQQDVDPILVDSIDTILQQIRIIKDLVAHFSQFSTMPDQKYESLDINDTIRDVVGLYKISYPDITYDCELQDYMPDIQADKKKLKRVFLNLLDNSVRALQVIEASERRIVIKTSFKTARKQIEILVIDSGPGISREVKERLFLPYVSSNNKNMGLGLAIVHEIIKKMGGTIKLLPGRGAIFQILLPISFS